MCDVVQTTCGSRPMYPNGKAAGWKSLHSENKWSLSLRTAMRLERHGSQLSALSTGQQLEWIAINARCRVSAVQSLPERYGVLCPPGTREASGSFFFAQAQNAQPESRQRALQRVPRPLAYGAGSLAPSSTGLSSFLRALPGSKGMAGSVANLNPAALPSVVSCTR